MAPKKSTVPGSQGGQITRGISDLSDDLNEGTVSEPLSDETSEPLTEEPQELEASSEAEETPSAPALAPSSAPASSLEMLKAVDKPSEEPPKAKRSPLAGAVSPSPAIKNAYKGRNAEDMTKQVAAYCMRTSKLRQGLLFWEFKDKVTYLVPKWFALTHPNVFVVKGE